MSRGLGYRERLILDSLAPDYRHGVAPNYSASQLASIIADSRGRPNVSDLVSVRRALYSLERKGLVIRREAPPGRSKWLWTLASAAKREARRQRRAREKTEGARRRKKFLERADAATATNARLAKLLGMLGSDHDGEVLSAARQVEAERRKLGKVWTEILG